MEYRQLSVWPTSLIAQGYSLDSPFCCAALDGSTVQKKTGSGITRPWNTDGTAAGPGEGEAVLSCSLLGFLLIALSSPVVFLSAAAALNEPTSISPVYVYTMQNIHN